MVTAVVNDENNTMSASSGAVLKKKGKQVQLWLAEKDETNNFVMQVSTGRHAVKMWVPIWSVVHVYRNLEFNMNYGAPEVTGRIAAAEEQLVGNQVKYFIRENAFEFKSNSDDEDLNEDDE